MGVTNIYIYIKRKLVVVYLKIHFVAFDEFFNGKKY